ncbi:MAG: HAD family hydrolase [Clostridia bacterium]|nr:HAD family hydrolase [Clostridia bacterium]
MNKISEFSKWLVISDIDGTLIDRLHRLPVRNIEAIADFVKKGGNFTLASSRGVESLFRHYKDLPLNNIPAVILNGAGIYDFGKKEMVYFNAMSRRVVDEICKIPKKFPTIDIVIITKDNAYVVFPAWWGLNYTLIDKIKHKISFNINSIPKEDWGKIVFSGAPWRVKRLQKYLNGIENPEFITCRASIFAIELMAQGSEKGTTALKLADMLGIDRSKTAGIGDFFNDFNLLRSVAVPAACGQAPKALKEIAEFVACRCKEGAVADFLEYLINEKILENN